MMKPRCNCKKNQCIKLYCACFENSQYCAEDGCNCRDCLNNKDHENERRTAVLATIERNPNAFRPKITTMESSSSSSIVAQQISSHHKGCHCKKSACLKKYCECFQMKIACTERCRCKTCQNTTDYVDRIYGKSSVLEEKLLRNRLDMVNKRDMSDGMNQQSVSERVGEGTKSSSMLQSFLGTESASLLDLPSQQEALVRKLDALGVALTDDVINQACLSMLKSAIPTRSSSQSTNSHNSNTIANTDNMSVVPTDDTLINGPSDMTNNYLASIVTSNGTEHTGQRRTRDNTNEKDVEIEGQPVNKRARSSSSHNHICTEGTEGSTDGDQTLVADDSEGPDDDEDEEGESDIEHRRRKISSMDAGNNPDNMHVANIVLSACHCTVMLFIYHPIK